MKFGVMVRLRCIGIGTFATGSKRIWRAHCVTCARFVALQCAQSTVQRLTESHYQQARWQRTSLKATKFTTTV